MNPNTGLDIAGLETAYDQLAMAIDAAGPEKSELFLVKLALLAAQADRVAEWNKALDAA